MKLLSRYRFQHFDTDLLLCGREGSFERVDLLVVDSNTRRFAPAGIPLVELAPGEQHKTLEQVEAVLSACVEHRLNRGSCLAALGGGVLCDLTGLAASLYMRGCRLVLLPSTLLAMVDAALGGKTGVDFHGYKNLVGSFYPAAEVRLIPELLQHLSVRDYRSGLAEVIKHALLAGGELHRYICQNHRALLECDLEHLGAMLPLAIDVKGQIVARDLYEQGERAYLNLGHTFAHALETVSEFAVTHGEAVAWGLVQAAQLSSRLGLCTAAYAQSVRTLVESFEFPLDYSYAQKKLIEAMGYDKKGRQRGVMRLVLQRDLGQTEVYPLSAAQLSDLLC